MDPRDQAIYNQDFRFVPQSRFLLAPFVPKTIDMSSPGITGIQQPLPYPYPPVNQGGGDGGGGITTDDIEDQGLTTADFAPDQSMTGDMGMTEEEQEAIDAYNNPQLSTTRGLSTAGLMAFGFLDPITAFGTLISQRNKQKKEAMQKAKEAAEQADLDKAYQEQMRAEGSTTGTYDTGGRYDGAGSKEEYGRDPTGFSGSSKNGGIIGYGGKSGTPLYQQFMNGGLADLVDIYD